MPIREQTKQVRFPGRLKREERVREVIVSRGCRMYAFQLFPFLFPLIVVYFRDRRRRKGEGLLLSTSLFSNSSDSCRSQTRPMREPGTQSRSLNGVCQHSSHHYCAFSMSKRCTASRLESESTGRHSTMHIS